MENLYFGLQVMVIGFTLIILVLYILSIILMIFSRVVNYKSKPSNRKTAAEPLATKPAWEETEAEHSPPEIVAAISAAIDYYLSDKNTMVNYQITKIEPQNNHYTSQWALQGRKDLQNMNLLLENIRREKFGQKIF